jgi:protoporphyrin/coproporphyrin ferrochelatase
MKDSALTLPIAPMPNPAPAAPRPAETTSGATPLPRPAGHPPVASGKIGVLLLNLGTPDGTDYWPMRRYLKEFLSDRRVIEVPRLIWWPLLNGIILTTRPGRKGKDYAAIWNKERNEGPLKTITRAQAEKLGAALSGHASIVVDWAMRYANPSTGSRIQALQAQGCDRILLVPLYPQYAAATTATAADQAFRALMAMRWQPAVRVAPAWHDDPVYIAALAQSVRSHTASLGYQPQILLATFHGMPRKYLDKGDPYHCQCLKTARLLREQLDWPKDRFVTAFQSRFGADEWLRPYTDQTVEALAKRGVKSLAMVAPGFSADCLETLEELDVENRAIFESNGGGKFSYVPCLNDSEAGLRVIEAIVRRELMGWV